MTPVKFKFLFPNGEPIANEVFKISLNKAAIHNSYDGMVYPEVLELTTDEFGEYRQELFPANQPYYVAMNLDEYAEDKPSLRFRIAVPDTPLEVWADDLIVQDPIWSQAWDAEAIEAIMTAKAEAQSAASQAKTSETNAANSATASQTSATNSATSATASAASATAAKASQDAAKVSENAAKASQTAAAGSATTAAAEAVKSANSATASAGSATQSANSATAALASQNAAKTSETNAKTSETNAKASETAANTSKNAAAASATQAATSATNSANSATAANTAKLAAEDAAARAESAAGTVTGVVSDMGPWSAAAGTYPTKPNGSAFWKVTANGTVNGIDYGIGDTLMYTKPTDEFYKIDNTEAVTSVAGRTGAITLVKGDVGLGNVDNTSDANKPISTATSTALAGKQGLNSKLTSISSVVLAVNDLLIADSTTTLAKIATGAIGRALLGAADAAAGRTTLGLGTSATYAVNTSSYGNTAAGGLGTVLLRNGSFGLGSTDMDDLASTDLDTVNATGFYQVAATCTNGPSVGVSGQLFVMTNATYYSTQLFSPQSSNSQLFFRSSVKHATLAQASYGPWLEVGTSVSMAAALAAVGLGTATTTLVTAPDSLTVSGEYYLNSNTTGMPLTSNGVLKHQSWNGTSAAIQYYSTLAAPARQFMRTKSSGTWNDWVETTLASYGIGITTPNASAIASGTDLNNMQTSGLYGQSQNANATAALNYPVVKAGSLLVQAPGIQITTQMYQEYDTGTVWTRSRYNTTWSAWRMQWDTTTLVKTSASTDATAGRLMQTGDFGWGTVSTPPTLANIDSTTAGTGHYRVAAPTGTMPTGAGTYGTLLYERYSAVLIKQTYTVNGDSASLPGSTWTRTYNGNAVPAAWSTWQRSTVQADITAWGVNTNIDTAAQAGYLVDMDNFDLANGLYAVLSATTGTKPSGQTWGMLMVTGRNFSVGRVMQTWITTDSNTFVTSTWKRLNYGRVWGAWVRDLTAADLVSPTYTGTVVLKGTNVLRMKNEGSTSAPAVITRLDTSNYYLLVTNADDQDGNFNALRPFSFNLTTGLVSLVNGASTASPTAGDRTTRVPTTSWVGTELTLKEDSIAAGTTSQYWRGDKGWRDFATDVRATALTGLSTASATTVTAADSVLAAMGKLQAQVTANNAATQPITRGGTGATTAAAARTNLGLGSASLSALIGSVTPGGAAVFESISNANGRAVKFADGTMICWAYGSTAYTLNNVGGALFNSTGITFTFPAPFLAAAGVPVVIPMAISTAGFYCWAGVSGLANHESMGMFLVSPGNGATSYAAYVAVGRWAQ